VNLHWNKVRKQLLLGLGRALVALVAPQRNSFTPLRRAATGLRKLDSILGTVMIEKWEMPMAL
jgi:hypothetical protein